MGIVSLWVLFVAACFWAAFRARPQAVPQEPHPSKELLQAKRQFIAAMNHRIFNEPKVSLQLQTHRDLIVGWYELKGPVTGVRFVVQDCCAACDKLDGRTFSLLVIRFLCRHVPPVHQEGGRQTDCSCTLLPVTSVPAPASATAARPVRTVPRSLPAGRR